MFTSTIALCSETPHSMGRWSFWVLKHAYHGSTIFFKGLQWALWAGSRAARVKITVSGIHNHLIITV